MTSQNNLCVLCVLCGEYVTANSAPAQSARRGCCAWRPNHTLYGMAKRKGKPFLGDFELTVLLAILRLGDEAYGAEILREIDQRTGRSVSGGALYITLDRMESKRLIKSRLGDPSANRGGRPRRYVTVTEKGFAAVRESRDAMLSMMGGLDSMFRRQ